MSEHEASPSGIPELRPVVEADAEGGPVLRLALVQSHPRSGPAETRVEGEAFCREARQAGAHLILFPEMYSVGYRTEVDFDDPEQVQEWRSAAVEASGPFLNHFRNLSRELELAVCMGFLERRGTELRNAAILFDWQGREVLTYAKVHTCRFFPMESRLTPGDRFPVATLETAAGTIRTGIMICYDREFPESARLLMLNGAELILTPNACQLNALRLEQFRARAWENAVAVAMASYASGQGDGHSCSYQADGAELRLAGSEAGVVYVDLDLGKLRAIRRYSYWGGAWRRPELYGPMSKPLAQPAKPLNETPSG